MLKNSLRYVVLDRVSVTLDTHVCLSCGENGFVKIISYEVVEQAQMDTLYDQILALWPLRDPTKTDAENVKLLARGNPIISDCFQATYQSQLIGPPTSQNTSYRCLPCLIPWFAVLDVTPVAMGRLLVQIQPGEGAVFVLQEFGDPATICKVVNHQDVARLYAALLEGDEL